MLCYLYHGWCKRWANVFFRAPLFILPVEAVIHRHCCLFFSPAGSEVTSVLPRPFVTPNAGEASSVTSNRFSEMLHRFLRFAQERVQHDSAQWASVLARALACTTPPLGHSSRRGLGGSASLPSILLLKYILSK